MAHRAVSKYPSLPTQLHLHVWPPVVMAHAICVIHASDSSSKGGPSPCLKYLPCAISASFSELTEGPAGPLGNSPPASWIAAACCNISGGNMTNSWKVKF